MDDDGYSRQCKQISEHKHIELIRLNITENNCTSCMSKECGKILSISCNLLIHCNIHIGVQPCNLSASDFNIYFYSICFRWQELPIGVQREETRAWRSRQRLRSVRPFFRFRVSRETSTHIILNKEYQEGACVKWAELEVNFMMYSWRIYDVTGSERTAVKISNVYI